MLVFLIFKFSQYSDDDDGKAWITYKIRGQKGNRGFLKQFGNSEHVICTSSDFEVNQFKKTSFLIKVQGSEFKVVAPETTFDSIHTKSVSICHEHYYESMVDGRLLVVNEELNAVQIFNP